MKKAIVTLSVILLATVSAFAGGDRSTNRPIYPKWYNNWFIEATGTLNAWQGSDRAQLIDPSTIHYQNANGDFGRYGGSLKIGKLVSPTVGVRLGVGMNQATNKYGDFIYESAHADVMLSLMDLFGGYRDNRVYRMILFGGFGVAGHANDWFQINNINTEYFATAGIMNNFRLGKSFDFHIDLNAEAPKWMIESAHAQYDPYLVDFNFSVGAGLTWYLGGRHFDMCDACPEVQCPEVNCDDKDKEIKNLLARIAELEGQGPEIVNTPCDTVVKFINGESAPFSIFFNKGSYELRDNRDLINLKEIAKVAKDNGYKINLRGSCDSATASSEFNKRLAENRCRKVKDELVKLGIAESNIEMNPVGGVSELKPTEYDRRVLITFTK